MDTNLMSGFNPQAIPDDSFAELQGRFSQADLKFKTHDSTNVNAHRRLRARTR